MSSTESNSSDLIIPPPSGDSASKFLVSSLDQYHSMYAESISDPDAFWSARAAEFLTFFRPFANVRSGSLENGDFAWFTSGQINACYNAVDRHLPARSNQVAILFEGDEPGEIRKLTYLELSHAINRLANGLKSIGVKKGDVVCIYMPMIPEAAVAMLACARIGAVHSVVFAGFSTDALRDRILDGNAKVVITADEGKRAKKIIRLKDVVDAVISSAESVTKVLVYRHTGGNISWGTKDLDWEILCSAQRPYCPPESMDSEDPLFLLYTSGSTGKPKGLVHTTAGYLLYAAMTQKYVFDYREGDIFGCMADVGWITGHSYIVYGPLANGATTFMFESTPLYPDASRYWDVVERHKINIFYTAPTAIRALMKFGETPVKKHNLSSLRVLGTVGEPINPSAWLWFHRVVGNSAIPIVDTYWQTETGGILISPLPGCTPLKPGSATLPFFGISPVLVDPHSGCILDGNSVEGALAIRSSWPGQARSVFGDHSRFEKTYLSPYKGLYFTGDGAFRDIDGFYWITGRIDDVLNVSGHRIGSAEVESALVAHKSVAEAAVVGVPHDIKGSAIFAYVTLKENAMLEKDINITTELQNQVREHLGAFARPDFVLVAPALPKTRSGKIMRRLLRKLASKDFDPEQLGDTSTLADPAVLDDLLIRIQHLD